MLNKNTEKKSRKCLSSESSVDSLTYSTCSDQWDDQVSLHGEKRAKLIVKR